MSFEHLQLNKQLCHRLYIASNGITRLYRPMLDKLDLTYPQYIIMMALWEVESASVLELQKFTKVDAGCLSLILKKLEAKKFITLKPTKEDKRKKIVSLSAKGTKLKDEAQSIPEKMVCNFKDLDPKDIEDLTRVLDKINSQLG
ncbi:MAG: MarR family transcriptional regulator [Bacteriovoracaceae bacterium]|nr:MarR family transcriptional regulator [Bacteriovoracaceae bacterium]